ncbi:lateral flagellar C-ring switch protein (FliG-like) [Escherichia coli]|uniref:flagellar basal body P-ring protein FlgI n=1 Tax=Escherichia coli TaxID=562 RepID=UPI001990B898|nr:lateral flagellar C-ring switch protein (FliG-like) [Escherichia coli]
MSELTINKSNSYLEQAAILLLCLGEEAAATVMQKLSREEVVRLSENMARLSGVKTSMARKVINNFFDEFREQSGINGASRSMLQGILNKALGTEIASSVINGIYGDEIRSRMARLQWVEPRQLAMLISEEHLQLQAVFLAFLTPEISAAVLSYLNESVQNEILYSLVVGLDGTGDKNQVKFTNQTITNMLRQFGVQLPNKIDPKVKNVAAVAVSATLPPMYSRGQTIDVTVSSIGDAKSIRGGTLLLTQLHGADGEVYALAQGSVVVGGMNATGASGSSVTVNTPTAGLIPNGATVEREIPSDFQMGDTITLNLKRPSFIRNIKRSISRRVLRRHRLWNWCWCCFLV